MTNAPSSASWGCAARSSRWTTCWPRSVWISSENTVVKNERRLLARKLELSGITDIAPWIAEAERRFLSFIDEHPGSTSSEIASDDPYLGHRLPLSGPGATATSQSVASRLLILTSAEGRVIRARPKGTWTSTQYTWSTRDHWRTDWPPTPTSTAADVSIARSWLFGHGPATIDDFSWWAGWPKGRSRIAIDGAGGIEVNTSEGAAFVLGSDEEPVSVSEPWVALLPGLDSSTMGWKRREFYLGPHANRLFDNVGNAGPTVWVSGKIVGGWVQLDDGRVAFQLFDDLGAEIEYAVAEKAAQVEQAIASVRLKPRARRWTQSEIELRNS